MTEPTIICPNCKIEIKLTESLAAPLVQATRKHYEQLMSEKDDALIRRQQDIQQKEENLAKEREALEATIQDKLKSEKGRIAEEEKKKAQLALAADIKEKENLVMELQTVLKSRDKKLADAQNAQAELMRKQRELEDATREMELTIQKQVQDAIAAARDKARKEVEDELKLKVMEKEQTITSMQKQIEELKRRAEQGSQQLQGEVQELDLEKTLQTKFLRDVVEPVPKGEHGGDVLQRVMNNLGQISGTIIWESKRTKAWSDGWLPKLREDQRTAKADIAVIVSQALPKDIEPFGLIDGVWVSSPKSAIPVAVLLRQALIEVATARIATEGQQTKTEMVYQYLTGPRFRQRVQAIVEAFSSMQEDLDKEKKVMTKQWAKREEQIDRVMQSTVGMYGDLQGIAGKSLQEIEGLEFKMLESKTTTGEE